MSGLTIGWAGSSNKGASRLVPSQEEREFVFQTIREAAAQRLIQVSLHTNLVRLTERGGLIVPVSLDVAGLSAYDEAAMLMNLGESWNAQQPQPPFRLLLTSPTALIEMDASIPLPADE